MTYSEEALKRLVSKKGVQYAIQTLSSPNLPKEIKADLAKKIILLTNIQMFY